MKQPGAIPAQLPPTQKKGAFGFLTVFFIIMFGVSALSFIASLFILANLDSNSYNYSDDSNTATLLMAGGVMGAILAGIGWAVASLGERLALRGVI
jgi:cytochrome bd-type quinol oxidase subunit 1